MSHPPPLPQDRHDAPRGQELGVMRLVEAGLLQYQLQSVNHHVLTIRVRVKKPTARASNVHGANGVDVEFSIFTRRLTRTCHPIAGDQGATSTVLVLAGGRRGAKRKIALADFLASEFPPCESGIQEWDMQQWWASNGKRFDWARLPVELQEHVLQFCVRNLSRFRDFFHGLPGMAAPARHQRSPPRHCEIAQRLGPWDGLLGVSFAVRAMVLRLSFGGGMYYRFGFCITSGSLAELGHRLHWLDGRFQTVLPMAGTHPRPSRPAALYGRCPKAHPELHRYATFKHGIRKICLDFDFGDYASFIDVRKTRSTMALHRSGPTSKCLDQLPHLNELILMLPRCYAERGPVVHRFFHKDRPCARKALRAVLEAAIAQLAHHNLRVHYFLDQREEARFTQRLATARSRGTCPDKCLERNGGVRHGLASPSADLLPAALQSPEPCWPPPCDCVPTCPDSYSEVVEVDDGATDAHT